MVPSTKRNHVTGTAHRDQKDRPNIQRDLIEGRVPKLCNKTYRSRQRVARCFCSDEQMLGAQQQRDIIPRKLGALLQWDAEASRLKNHAALGIPNDAPAEKIRITKKA